MAYFLARQDAKYASELHSILDQDIGLAHIKVLEIQLKNILVNPSRSAFDERVFMPVLGLDALDECSDARGVATFLQLLLRSTDDLPFKIFITSRPENQIEVPFSLHENIHPLHATFILHNVEEYLVKSDIWLFLANELKNIGIYHKLPPDWVTAEDVTTLASLADRLFIYASTLAKYIRESPQSRLRNLVDKRISHSTPLTKDLDSVYSGILAEAVDPNKREEHEIDHTVRVLATVLAAREILAIDTIGQLLDISSSDVEESLKSLHSLVLIREDKHVTTFHASLGDYLTDRHRSGDKRWHIRLDHAHHDIVRCCLCVALKALKFNVSGIYTSYDDNKSNSPARSLPGHIVYTCLFWVDHITRISEEDIVTLHDQVVEFFETKFLFWIEILSLLDMIYEASAIIMNLSVALRKVCYRIVLFNSCL